MDSNGVQPRYAAYARARGMTPDEVWNADAERYPGGPGFGYMQWVQSQWSAWMAETGRKRPFSDTDHHDFDEWLGGRRDG